MNAYYILGIAGKKLPAETQQCTYLFFPRSSGLSIKWQFRWSNTKILKSKLCS